MHISSSESSKTSTLDEALVLIDEMGGARALVDDLAEFERLRVRMAEDYGLLLDKHPDRWVAMGKDGLLAVGSRKTKCHGPSPNRAYAGPTWWLNSWILIRLC